MGIIGIIDRINGSLIRATFKEAPKIGDLVEVGDLKLMGEIVRLDGHTAFCQCYEITDGIRPGEPVVDTGEPLMAELGPGIMGAIMDGVERSETELWNRTGPFVSRGTNVPPLDRSKKWEFVPTAKKGDKVTAGDFIGNVQETKSFVHKIMVPPGMAGTIKSVHKGEFTVEETVAELETADGVKKLTLMQKWPVRRPRPVKQRLPLSVPLLTGQRVIDTFFPCAKGGAAAIPGGFGTGKTVTLQQISKWSDADIIILIGCGERGNEMADVVAHFPYIKDPRSGRDLIERTIIVANVSNMPVSAREASIYMGVTLGEYFRDMGYDVAVMADSTSRWAEALRDISGRLGEIPAEAGFPAYLPDRIAELYERAGRAIVSSSQDRLGSVTILGAVSPPGGDFSEPVTTYTLRFIGTFWALDSSLAQRRHFPAINWLRSFTRYLEISAEWWSQYDKDWLSNRAKAMSILEEAAQIEETARIIGEKSLPDDQRLVLLIAELLREGFLVQAAYHEIDTYCDADKQTKLLRIIIEFNQTVEGLVKQGVPIEKVRELPIVTEMQRLKERKGSEPIAQAKEEMVKQVAALAKTYGVS